MHAGLTSGGAVPIGRAHIARDGVVVVVLVAMAPSSKGKGTRLRT